MNISGLQKMTLLDFPGRVACTVFLGGCDFRCQFCHNYELVENPTFVMSEGDFFDFLKKRRGLLDGVAVTGGEPCIYKELPEFLRKIRDLGFLVKLDTNGNHPKLIESVLQRQLVDYVAMDIKNSPGKYAQTIHLTNFDMSKVQESVKLIMTSAPEYEFRTTVIDELHNVDDFEKIGQWIAGCSQYYLQPFVDRDTVPCHEFHAPSMRKIRLCKETVEAFVKNVHIRGI